MLAAEERQGLSGLECRVREVVGTKMVVGFRGTTGVSVDGGGDLSKWRRVATLAGCRVAVVGA